MSDSPLILVDTNIIFDVTGQDARWADWSLDQMSQYVGRMLINPLIYTELCYGAESENEVDSLIATLGLGFEELSRQALFVTSQVYKIYRQRGGTKSSPLPDFFIGAHAAVMGIPILTRDVTRYQTYFPTVPLIAPGVDSS